ncbi:MAG: hypothetical protein AB4372_27485 [Xenococcus sp. (in: cyanobacteria)]
MNKVDITIKINIANGPTITENIPTQNIDTYDQIIFELPTGGTKNVALLPDSQNQDNLLFLMLKSNLYDVSTDQQGNTIGISYSFKTGEQDNNGQDLEKKIVLDKPHLYQGAGETSLVKGDLKTLTFKNELPGTTEEEKEQNKAEIQILVGRKAVTTAPTEPTEPTEEE